MEPERLASLRVYYEAGQLSMAELSARFGLSASRIESLAKARGWLRNTPPPLERVLPLVPPVFSEDPTEHATISAAHIVQIHRTDVARLRSISSTLVERLSFILSGQLPMSPDGNPLPTLGARESPADLLEKLSRVLVRTTEIERQSYGLTTFDPNKQASQEELDRELAEMEAEMERLARERSAN
jgi:hypothetical protein